MNNKLYTLLILAGFFLLSCQEKQESLTILSYNIKNDYQKEGQNNWTSRKDALIEQLDSIQPTVFGVQEALFNQLADLKTGLKNYEYSGVSRDGSTENGEFTAIFYHKDKVQLRSSETNWFGGKKRQKHLDAAFPRIYTSAIFQTKSGIIFQVINTHLDHIGEASRAAAAEELNQLGQKRDIPQILLGDFNAIPDSEPIQTLKNQWQDSRKTQDTKYSGTFNGFNEQMEPLRIDYIFYRDLNPEYQVHLHSRMKNNRYISDHYPVIAKFNFQR